MTPSLKHLFWFLYTPNDEREHALYKRAFHISGIALIILSSIVLPLFFIARPNDLSFAHVSIFLGTLVLAPSLAGLFTLRAHDLSFTYTPSLYRVCLHLIAFNFALHYLVSLAIVLQAPQTIFDALLFGIPFFTLPQLISFLYLGWSMYRSFPLYRWRVLWYLATIPSLTFFSVLSGLWALID